MLGSTPRANKKRILSGLYEMSPLHVPATDFKPRRSLPADA